MAYRRGSYGIEYRPEEPSEDTPWLLWAAGLLVAIGLLYGAVRLYRWAVSEPEPPPPATVAEEKPRTNRVAPPEPSEPNVSAPKVKAGGKRPRRVENLLLKLDEAISSTNYPVQIATIEELRSLPGNPAADLDDTLARALGRLKMRRLFGKGGGNEWVKSVTVKRGDSASRIAVEHGTTLKCLAKLNGDVSSIRPGQVLKVMNHPQFRLAVYRRTKIADLYLDGRFFKRYNLVGEVSGENGSYVFPAKTRALFSAKGVKFSPADLEELEMLLPKDANMTIADFR